MKKEKKTLDKIASTETPEVPQPEITSDEIIMHEINKVQKEEKKVEQQQATVQETQKQGYKTFKPYELPKKEYKPSKEEKEEQPPEQPPDMLSVEKQKEWYLADSGHVSAIRAGYETQERKLKKKML
jgi:hypothetical protein